MNIKFLKYKIVLSGFFSLFCFLLISYVFAQQANYCPDLKYFQSLGSRDAKNKGETTKLQKFLKQNLGLTDYQFIITGYFGQVTKEFVKQFQENNGLVISGMVGAPTRAMILNTCNSITNTNAGSTIVPTNDTNNNQNTNNTTYSWTVGSWSDCSGESRQRTVTCIESNGNVVDNAMCRDIQPQTTESCTLNNNNNTGNPSISCTLGGQIIEDGGSINAYQYLSVQSPSQCISEQRNCFLGNLSGSFTETSCSVLPAISQCTPSEPETRESTCPDGQTGSMIETRSQTCSNNDNIPTWGDWQVIINSCSNTDSNGGGN